MDTEGLLLLEAVHRLGSLNRAARELGIGQSTASRRLAALEDAVGLPLFDRLPRGLASTALALALLPHAQAIARQLHQAERVIRGTQLEPAGRVRLAVVEGLARYTLLPRLTALRERHPRIELDLIAGHALVDLARREADLALRFVRPTAPDLVVRQVVQLPMGAFVHPRLSGHEPLPWLAVHDPDQVFQETRWIAEVARPSHLTTFGSWHDLLEAARLGVGAALLSPWVANAAGLVPIEVPQRVPARELLLVYHRALRDVPAIAAVRSWVLEAADAFVEQQRAADPP